MYLSHSSDQQLRREIELAFADIFPNLTESKGSRLERDLKGNVFRFVSRNVAYPYYFYVTEQLYVFFLA